MKKLLITSIITLTVNTALCQTPEQKKTTKKEEPTQPKKTLKRAKPPKPTQWLSPATPLFNGKDLTGWKVVNPKYAAKWSVQNGAIVSGDLKNKIQKNTYLATTEQYQNFELSCLFRIQGDPATGLINSGIQYRSIIKGSKIIGYQADIGTGYWGNIYDEHRRRALITADISTLKLVLNETGWNTYTIRCKGNIHELYINGIKTAHYTEKDPKIPSKGHIAVQIHSGGKAKVEFRNITITHL